MTTQLQSRRSIAILPWFCKPKQIAWSAKLLNGFCKNCRVKHKLLTTNCVAKLYDCSRKECSKKLVKVLYENSSSILASESKLLEEIKTHWNKGKHLSAETRDKISATLKAKHSHRSAETKAKTSKSLLDRKSTNKEAEKLSCKLSSAQIEVLKLMQNGWRLRAYPKAWNQKMRHKSRRARLQKDSLNHGGKVMHCRAKIVDALESRGYIEAEENSYPNLKQTSYRLTVLGKEFKKSDEIVVVIAENVK